MKRFLCLFLIAVCLIPLLGCNSPSFEATLFYYCRRPESYNYFEENSIIVSEGRDLSGHRRDLKYLVALYLAGPLDEELISPFPRKTRLLEEQLHDEHLLIELTDVGSTLTDAEFSLAATCLAKTCIGYIGCKDVTVKSGARAVTITADNVMLYDSAIPETSEGE